MATIINIGNNTGNTLGTQDDRIDSISPDNNNGAHANGYCGLGDSGRELRELQRWSLTAIPAGSICTSATLYLYDDNWGNRTQDCTINIYQIADANGDWIEGTTTDSPQNGSPSWDHKAYPSTNWAGSAGLKTSDTDYISTSLGSAIFTDGVTGYRGITFNATGLSVLQNWFGSVGGNGWILIGTGNANCWTEWQSRQGTDGQRPYLQITYSDATPLVTQSIRRQLIIEGTGKGIYDGVR